MKITIFFQPKGKSYIGRLGESLLQSARRNRVHIGSRCGGNGSCTTCKVKLLTSQPNVSAPSQSEMRFLGEEAISQGFRLACQTRVYGSVEVEVLESTWKTKMKTLSQLHSDTDEGM